MPFKILRNDITKMQVDAIVNAVNPNPGFASGTDSVIYKKAGIRKLLERRKKIGAMKPGQAAVTPAFDLDAKYIIHTVGPIYRGGGFSEEKILRTCYENCLKLAVKQKCESIAFPLISAGNYGYPKDEAMQVALSEISRFLSKNEMLVYLVVFDAESFSLSKKLFTDIDAYIDDNYVQETIESGYHFDDRATESIILPKMGENNRPQVPEEPSEEWIFTAQRRLDRPQMQSRPCTPMDTTSFSVPGVCREASVQYRSLDDVMAQLEETFQERLLRLIDERGFTDVQVYKKANLSRKLFSKIRCNSDYHPKKMTAIALAVALELNLDEIKDLLARAELALSPSNKFDVIIRYFIERKIYDIYTINLALFEHGLPTMGE